MMSMCPIMLDKVANLFYCKILPYAFHYNVSTDELTCGY